MKIQSRSNRRTKIVRKLQMENLATRQTMNADFDDQISEARPIQVRQDLPVSVSGIVDSSVDVDMYAIDIAYGQTIDFDIDTPQNGPGGLGAYLRIFDSQGVQIAANNDAAAPGESRIGFDSYLRHNFHLGGRYYVGISNWTNTRYNAVNGSGDTPGHLHSTGTYRISVQALPVDGDDAMVESTKIGDISRVPRIFNSQINWDVDVDMFSFRVTSGQTVDIDIDTRTNGPGGLGSYLRLFNSYGQLLAVNNDGAAPGESLGFDSFIRYRFSQGGTYFVGVSNWLNTNYNPINGSNDAASWQHAVGDYSLVVTTAPVIGAAPIHFSQAAARNDVAPTSDGNQIAAEVSRIAQLLTSASNSDQQDWSNRSKSESSRSASKVAVDNWYANLDQLEADLLQLLTKSI
jgi:Bacterial pre-peptidase C-terminal domain